MIVARRVPSRAWAAYGFADAQASSWLAAGIRTPAAACVLEAAGILPDEVRRGKVSKLLAKMPLRPLLRVLRSDVPMRAVRAASA